MMQPPMRTPFHSRLRLVALCCAMMLSELSAPAWESALFTTGWVATPDVSFETNKLIQDFSFAGYRRGEIPLPSTPPGGTYDVVAGFSADPTGTTDSTVAIQSAINAAAAAGGGIVWMPAGTYRISPQGADMQCLRIASNNVVLRGAGIGQTFLLNTQTVMRNMRIIDVAGPNGAAWATTQNPSTLITNDLLGPVTQIPVASVAGFAVGDHIIVRADPGDDWANEHLEPGWVGYGGSYGRLMYLRQIQALDAVNNRITVDIPTRYALKTRDNARVYKKTTLITGVALENFSIGNVQHPGTSGWGESDNVVVGTPAYEVSGHFAIRFLRVRDGWIRNVATFSPAGNTTTTHILNNGILLQECRGITIKGCHFQRPQYGGAGGSGYMYRVQNSGDCLLQNCTAEFSRHGFVFSHMASSGNVIHACLDKTTGKQTGNTGNQNTSGRGSDHHMHFSHSNLIDACVADDSWFEARYRPFGSVPLHNLTAAHTVFWNLEGKPSARTYVVHSQQSRYGYVIGTRGAVSNVLTSGTSTEKTTPVDHVEGVGMGGTLTPFSLFREQRRRRLNLPTIAAQPPVELLFPNDTVALSPTVNFGDSMTVPGDAAFQWSQTAGPMSALLQPSNTAPASASLPLPGSYTLALVANRHGSFEDDFSATNTVTVTLRPAGWSWLELSPVADAYVHGDSPDSTFNNASLWMKNVNGTGFDREIFMRFDLSSVAGRTIHHAELVLHATDPDTAATANTHWVPDDMWTETGVTWNTRPAVSDLLSTWALSPDFVQRVDLTARAAIEAAGDGLLSLRHGIVTQQVSATIFKYASRENANAGIRPRLRLLVSVEDPSFAAWISGYPEIPSGLREAGADADGDGLTNFEEYALRRQPYLAEGNPGAIRLEAAGESLHLRIPGGAALRGGAYPQVEYRPSLDGGTWQTLLPGNLQLEGDDLMSVVPSGLESAPQGFLRVRFVEVP